MDLIKLPMSLGLIVTEILKKQNIEPRKIEDGPYKGMLNFEFSQEELDLIKDMTINNPSSGCLDGIENLHFLESLSITTHGSTAYQLSPASINDKDISRIAKLKSLKSLKIDNQSKITWVYLDHLENLENIEITRNASLTEIFGLNKLHKAKDFVEYGNKELFMLDGLGELIEHNNLENIELDFLHFDELHEFIDKLDSTTCCFSETLRSRDITIDYTLLKMLYFHKKCLAIAELAKNFSSDWKAQIIFVEYYLAKNIVYDDEAKNRKNRAHYEKGVRRGKEYGINSAYNGIMYGSAVCEGYTRSMQYILKLMGYKSKNVYCLGGANKISINENYHNKVTLPKGRFHSIIRIDNQNSIYYCDPCWDSCRFHGKDTTLPYCLLTKKEILKSHSLSFEEDDVIYDIPYPRDYVSDIVNYLKEIESTKEDEIEEKKK